MTAAIFPAYGIARTVLSQWWALAAATLAIAAPALSYSPILVEEPLARLPRAQIALGESTAAATGHAADGEASLVASRHHQVGEALGERATADLDLFGCLRQVAVAVHCSLLLVSQSNIGTRITRLDGFPES